MTKDKPQEYDPLFCKRCNKSIALRKWNKHKRRHERQDSSSYADVQFAARMASQGKK